MGNINGLHGLVLPSSSTLIAAFGGDMINVATGLGYGLNLTPGRNVEFENFLQSLFFQNYFDTPLTFDGTKWSRANVGRVPLAKYIRLWKGQLYLGYVSINGVEYPSRIWRSDVPRNNALTWGFEYGNNLSTIGGNTLVSSANAGFLANNIKRGDPFYITSGNSKGEYRVSTVAADQQILLTNIYPFLAPTITESGLSYWAGGNWLDFDRDDGDFITGISENTYQLIVFKRDSLHRYDGLKPAKVRGAVGTTAPRSIINLHELTIYFYGGLGIRTGFYAYDGRESIKISAPIEDYIQGIDMSNYTTIAAWEEGELYRAFVGDINNSNQGLVVPKAVCTWNYNTRTWSIDPIADAIVVGADFRQNAVKQAFLATDQDEIMITPSGYSFNTAPVPWRFNTTTTYPAGTEVINTFTRIQVLSDNANGITVKYKLHLTPFDSDKDFNGLGQITNERTEFTLPEGRNLASGIEFQFSGTGVQEPTPLIKKVSIFYKRETNVIL